jgi:serine/threonine protein kinase
VWLCTDERLHRQVAVKSIGSLPGESPDDTARAMREARLTAALNHSSAVSVYDVVEHGGTTWLVMEYLASSTLSQLIAAEGRLSPHRVAHIGAQVAAALSSAHSLGIIHRDIKPGNILVGEDDVAKISDFGIARGHTDMRLTQTGMVTGTPAFFSPELARGDDATFASDVWALGITLYTATEGAPPYPPQTNPLAMLSVIAHEPPPRPVHAGPLTGVLAAMLDPDVTRRSTMAEVLAALTEVERRTAADRPDTTAEAPTTRHEQPVQAPTPQDAIEPAYEREVVLPAASGRWVDRPADSPSPPARRRSRVGRLVTGALGLLVLLGAAALLVNVLESGSGSSPNASSTTSGAGANTSAGTPHHSGGSPGTAATTSASTVPSPSTTPNTRLYYSTVPGDLDAGWSMLAPSMQRSVGRASYDSFWSSIKSVQVSSVDVVDATTVRYRITYTSFNGKTSVETKQLTLRKNGSSYLITSDSSAQ